MLDNVPDVLTVKQLQEVLSIGRNRAYRLLNNGEIPYIKIGKQMRIPKVYLIDFLSKAGYNIKAKSSMG